MTAGLVHDECTATQYKHRGVFAFYLAGMALHAAAVMQHYAEAVQAFKTHLVQAKRPADFCHQFSEGTLAP